MRDIEKVSLEEWIEKNFNDKEESEYPYLTFSSDMPFGQYKGSSLRSILDDDPGYIRFLIEDIDRKVLSYSTCVEAFKYGVQNCPHDYCSNVEYREFRREIKNEIAIDRSLDESAKYEVQCIADEAMAYEDAADSYAMDDYNDAMMYEY
ncbi:MAG: hypothetical protein WBG43_07170 [Marinifilaceae bacterium]